MFSFLSDFFRRPGSPQTVILLDDDGLAQPRRHEIRPMALLWMVAGIAILTGITLTLFVIVSPLRALVPGVESQETMHDVRLSVLRLQAMQDSLEMQQHYLAHLRQLVVGQLDSAWMAQEAAPAPGRLASPMEVAAPSDQPPADDWVDHEQPALSFWRFQSASGTAERPARTEIRNVASLRLPVLPPVEGFLSRGFDARSGHFGVDFVVDEGTIVRSVGDGYIIFADWTHEGGYTIAVQHSDGYVSVYKHNQRLMKRVGERVRSREAIALSGDTGETSTGPHLHFEFWQNGLAQDPRYYFIGE
jgi:murein DD-endopeptidase MepM/ murein hydrolase activator NlpD